MHPNIASFEPFMNTRILAALFKLGKFCKAIQVIPEQL